MKMFLISLAAAALISGAAACQDSREYKPPEDASRAAPGMQAVAQPDATSEDGTITSKVQAVIAAEPTLNTAFIAVETKAGVVTLSGTVGSIELRSKAEELARSVDGVRLVNNELSIKVDTASACCFFQPPVTDGLARVATGY